MLEFTADAVAVRYQIDGVWHNATPKVRSKSSRLDRPLGDAMLLVLKRICHLKPQERRAKQEGKMQDRIRGQQVRHVASPAKARRRASGSSFTSR